MARTLQAPRPAKGPRLRNRRACRAPTRSSVEARVFGNILLDVRKCYRRHGDIEAPGSGTLAFDPVSSVARPAWSSPHATASASGVTKTSERPVRGSGRG